MGTDLESTIKELKQDLRYFLDCCKPENELEIKIKFEALVKELLRSKDV